MSSTVTALIVDDEAHLRQHLRHRLEQVWPQLQIVAEANNAHHALQIYQEFQPDIVFLDIKMPGQSGLEIAHQLVETSTVVFVTAYDMHAIEAFEKGAIDYLLKPIEPDRLQICCQRLQERIHQGRYYAHAIDQIKNSFIQLAQMQRVQQEQERKFLRWIQAGVGNGLRLISTSEILYFRADEKYTCVRTEQAEYLIRKTLKELEDELNPQDFWRVHRSALVRVSAIAHVAKDDRGRHLLCIRGVQEKIEVSRNHTHLFQQM